MVTAHREWSAKSPRFAVMDSSRSIAAHSSLSASMLVGAGFAATNKITLRGLERPLRTLAPPSRWRPANKLGPATQPARQASNNRPSRDDLLERLSTKATDRQLGPGASRG